MKAINFKIMIEIERKFLPSADFNLNEIQNLASKSFAITQGYICDDVQRTVRIRTKSDKGFITIKGIGNDGNVSRFEWEKEISVDEANALLKLCLKGVIRKMRYEVLFENHIFEIDVFDGDNKGLIIIELELESETEAFEKPDWLGEEVTTDNRYFNSYISQKPYLEW